MAGNVSVAVFLETSSGTNSKCGCPAYGQMHVHTLLHGQGGIPGPRGCTEGGKPSIWKVKPDHKPKASTDTNLSCTCKVGGNTEHVHVTTRGPLGPEGPPGFPGNYEGNFQYNTDYDPRLVTVIRNCEWCGRYQPHHHAVFEGNVGLQGPQGFKE